MHAHLLRLLRFVLPLALAAAVGACGGDDDDNRPTRVVVFGDSWSDDGAEKALTQRMVAEGVSGAYVFPGPASVYPAGNWSNGPTAVTQFAAALGVPIENHAMGGASSGRRLYDNPPGMPALIDAYLPEGGGVIGQVERYRNSRQAAGGRVDPDTLHILWASGNDFFLWADFGLPGTPADVAAQAVANFRSAFNILKGMGAARVLFVNSQYAANEANVYGAAIGQFKAAYNPALAALVAELSAANPQMEIRLFDVFTAVKSIVENPAAHGLTNVTQPCQRVYSAPAPTPPYPPACATPDTYFYWDEFHPTRKASQLVARRMLDLYP
jgi:cholinesterase